MLWSGRLREGVGRWQPEVCVGSADSAGEGGGKEGTQMGQAKVQTSEGLK